MKIILCTFSGLCLLGVLVLAFMVSFGTLSSLIAFAASAALVALGWLAVSKSDSLN